MSEVIEMFVPITDEHSTEILDGCMGYGSYSTMPYSSIDNSKYKFRELLKTVYKEDNYPPTDANIIGWNCRLEII